MLVVIPLESVAGGLRKVVAASRFENRTSYRGQIAINDAMADQLTDALIQSGQFTVVERQTVRDVLGEQDFANSGRVAKAQTARTGKIVAAQILIKGTVTEYSGSSSKQGEGFRIGGIQLNNKSSEAHVGLMIRLIDSSSGEVLDSQRVEGKAKSKGKGFSANFGGLGYSKSGSESTPMGKATQVAIDNAVQAIADRLAKIPFQTRVIKNTGSDLVIAAGAKVGAQIGDQFTVYSLGEEFVDPYTGESLGSEETEVGVVKITQVKEKYSRAAAVGSLGSVETGDIVRQR